ncbi:MAG TPA: PIG-L family deacetylase [Vicinamibacterales bacterium]|nr:PIG-L family deacetylase [Vicinamibacterales bacterium]
MHIRRPSVLILIIAFVWFVPASVRLPAQLRVAPVAEHPGDVSLELLLRKLDSSATFMETTAHPDDEDNALLAMLGHGQGMRTVLVTTTRGDGGQNEIGPELFEALGMLRSEELLAVHRFDGAEQYFTRAIDFGYSFSVEESIERWGHDEILGDFVHHIRAVRPDVIAGFLCGGDGGGQHHQASAQLTVEAFRAAADPSKYPEQIAAGLRPWQATRVFCTDVSGFGRGAQQRPQTPDLLTVNASGFDSALGRTYAELGLEARSMHKCQGTSQLLLLPGQSQNRVYRLRDSVVDPKGQAPKRLFDGIDTSLTGLARFAGKQPPSALTSALQSVAKEVAAARRALADAGPAAATPPLAAGLRAVRHLRAQLASMGLSDDARYEIDVRLEQKERQFEQALVVANGIRLEALADDGVVTPGQQVALSIYATTNASQPATLNGVELKGFEGAPAACTGTLRAAAATTCKMTLTIPASTHLSTPYWTRHEGADRYDWESGVPFGVPFRPSPFHATFTLTIGGEEIGIDRIVQYRYDNVMAGEKRTELQVSPAFDVRVTPDITVIPYGAPVGTASASAASQGTDRRSRQIEVSVANNQTDAVNGQVTLQAPQGWRVDPAAAPVTFGREDEEQTVTFTVSPPDGVRPGEVHIAALMTSDAGVRSTQGYQTIEYPHIHLRHLVSAADTRVKVIDVKIAPGLRVGYIMGVGDQVPPAIAQLGAQVDMITPAALASGDLSKYNVIVTGVRAYERRADLRAHNQRLIEYARQGGTVIVQYNKFEFNQAQYGPYPAKVSSNRVTDENAPIEILDPANPIFNTPNTIGPDAWRGWVQERGLYFLGEKDARYKDLVRSQDPFPFNAGPKTGALVEATVGQGRWIYVGLGLWRQLPAGTDGAYRLMANLLSLGAR